MWDLELAARRRAAAAVGAGADAVPEPSPGRRLRRDARVRPTRPPRGRHLARQPTDPLGPLDPARRRGTGRSVSGTLRGLVFRGPGRPLAIETLRLDAPGPGEVAVRMLASGVCHSDLHVVDGEWARPTDVVLGHEGSAVVTSARGWRRGALPRPRAGRARGARMDGPVRRLPGVSAGRGMAVRATGRRRPSAAPGPGARPPRRRHAHRHVQRHRHLRHGAGRGSRGGHPGRPSARRRRSPRSSAVP